MKKNLIRRRSGREVRRVGTKMVPEKLEERVLENVEENRKNIIDLLAKMVKIPSITGEEGEAQEFVKKCLTDLGLEVDVWEPDIEELFLKFVGVSQYPSHWQHDLILPYGDLPTYDELIRTGKIKVLNYKNRPNVVGRLKGSGKGRSIILNGHIDVITVEPKENWTVDPFGAQVKDNRMFGRGTTDMKGGLAAAISAVQCLIETDVELKGDVIIESVVNEEHSGMGTLACVARGILGDAAIFVEPSDFEITTSKGGNVYWEVRVKGESRSPGSRWETALQQVGVSAIEKIPAVIKGLVDLEAEFNNTPVPLLFKGKSPSSLVMGKITGGTYETVTAGGCSIKGTIYFSPYIGSVKQVMGKIKDAISKASKRDPWLKEHPPEVWFLHHRDKCEVDPDEPIIEIIKSSTEKVLGVKPPVVGSLGPDDAIYYVNQAKVPSVTFGPGSVSQCHIVDEYIKIDDVMNATKLFALTILGWCK
jgi:acetylornithine deacetylase